jgi:hypothetical protein
VEGQPNHPPDQDPGFCRPRERHNHNHHIIKDQPTAEDCIGGQEEEGAITSNYFKVRPGNKDIVFIRTESGRFFKISSKATRRIKTDGHIDENNGLVRKAVQVPSSYVAELYSRFGSKPKVKGRGKASKIRRFRKEATI